MVIILQKYNISCRNHRVKENLLNVSLSRFKKKLKGILMNSLIFLSILQIIFYIQIFYSNSVKPSKDWESNERCTTLKD